MAKCVLLSTFPLPYHLIGSWTNSYDYLLSQSSQVDYLISPQPAGHHNEYKHIKYIYLKFGNRRGWTKYFYKYRYINYLKIVDSILIKEDKLILKVIDNVRLLKDLHGFLLNKGLRNRCRIVFSQHGYSYFFSSKEGVQFYEMADHLILLTKQSYELEVGRYSYITSKISILPNGVNSQKFYKLSKEEKNIKKEQLGYKGKKICLWLSKERPKKGLHILLEAWHKSKLRNLNDFVLIIIGTSNNEILGNIHYKGKIPNDQLPEWYQISDFYMFTSLVHEGFSLSLTEALKSGCTVIASELEPLPEILMHGEYGHLIPKPHNPDSWNDVLDLLADNKLPQIEFSRDELDKLYDLENWRIKMNELIREEKQLFDRKSSFIK